MVLEARGIGDLRRAWLVRNPVSQLGLVAGQAIIGTALGAGFSPKTLQVILEHAGIFLFAVVFILPTSLLNGWLLIRA
jgi:uncharacterized membrane protein AbrB (regulator of aidB expression)